VAQADSIQALQERLANEQRLIALMDRIHAVKSLDGIFLEFQEDILTLTDAERMTLYAIDPDKRELYSKYVAGDVGEVREIRVPISDKSLAGYVAGSRKAVNIADAYDRAELNRIAQGLTFDATWDQKTGFKTKQVLAVPITNDNRVVGVLQLLNKKRGPRFAKEDESSVARIAKTLGIALNTQFQLAQKRAGKFDYLLAHQLITQDELNLAMAEARRRQTDVESILIEQ
jgi:GAF domain-containing protein